MHEYGNYTLECRRLIWVRDKPCVGKVQRLRLYYSIKQEARYQNATEQRREMGNVGVRAFPREGCNQQQHGTNPERHK